jgi:mRNA interferase RelE/StbE
VYRLELRPSAAKDLDRLTGEAAQRVFERVRALRDDPRPAGCVKLAGDESAWRIRIGDWRVIYDIDDAARLITILRVKHRRDVYRNL